MRFRTTCLAVALMLLSSAFHTGCALFQSTQVTGVIPALASDPPNSLSEDDRDYVADSYGYEVRVSGNEQLADAVRELRNEDWDAAVSKLEAFLSASEKNSRNDRAHYALGIAYEQKRDFAKALEHYEEANKIPSKTNPDYDASRKRARAKLAFQQGR